MTASERLEMKRSQEHRKRKALLLSSGWQKLTCKDRPFLVVCCSQVPQEKGLTRQWEIVWSLYRWFLAFPISFWSHFTCISYGNVCTYLVLAQDNTGRAGCDVKKYRILRTGQAAPTCLTACIYPASKPGFVWWNWKVIAPSSPDHISVYRKLSLPSW